MNANVTIDRHKYIGGSDIPIIMGISPFKSRFDLLLEKAGLQENNFSGNEYTEYGVLLEPKIRDYINSFRADPFCEDTLIKGCLRGNFDGISSNEILEIKTTSQIKETIDEYKVYLVQLLFYMQLAEKSQGTLAVYERPDNFYEVFNEANLTTYTISIDDYADLVSQINFAVESFLADLEKVKANPLITEEELQPAELITLSNRVVELESKIKEYKEIEAEYKELKDKLKTAMEKNQIKKWTTNNGTQITLVLDGKDTTVEVFDEKKFKEENEELYLKYVTEKVKKGKRGYVKITG